MMSDINFFIKFRENLSSMMPRMARTAQSVFSDIGRGAAGAQARVSGLRATASSMGTAFTGSGAAAVNALNNIGSAARNAERDVARMNSASRGAGEGGGFLKTSGAMALGNLASQGIMMAGREVMGFVKDSLDKGMDAEQSIIGLQTFVGKDKAKSIYKGLQKQAVLTPFTTADMLPVEMGLVATGMSPERANKDMMNLMNAVSATGNAGNSFMFQLMGSHLSQAASAGKIDGLLLREFQRTAHIPITRLIANDMFPNLSPQAGMKKVDALDSISYDRFAHALQRASEAGGMFAGAMEAQSQTIRGKKSTILDYLGIGQAGAVLNPRMHDNIVALEDKIISGLKDFPEQMERMQPVFSRMFDEFNDMLPYMKDFGGSLIDMLKPVGAFLLSDSVKEFAKNILVASTSISNSLLPVLEEIRPIAETGVAMLSGAAGIVGSVIDRLGKLPGAIMTAWDEWTGGKKTPAGNGLDYSSPKNPLGMDETLAAMMAGKVKGIRGVSPIQQNTPPSGADAATQETSDAIIGGGKRVVNFTFKNLVETINNNPGSTGEAVSMTERDVKGLLARLLAMGADIAF